MAVQEIIGREGDGPNVIEKPITLRQDEGGGPNVIEKPITLRQDEGDGPNVIEKPITLREGVRTQCNRKTDHIARSEEQRLDVATPLPKPFTFV
ncbi:hypothetical protein NSS64_11405 [Paenibacillus sp. FSL H8-0122]|uniref:hypothetical protein n=1 Tax=Paenibacillus sp. FSL H8-0122 TaxID=2954510 RepID=UPI0030FB1382